MSDQTKIEWADKTWNPWEGCTKVSPGCAHCYAEARNHRFGMDNWGKGKPRRRTSKDYWKKPLKWNRDAAPCVCDGDGDILPGGQCSYCGLQARRPRIFPSLCDWLDEEVPIEWLADFLKLIRDTPNLDWLLLTKRPENFLRIRHIGNAGCATSPGMKFPRISQWAREWFDGHPPSNVWVGVSIEDQQRADERIPQLLKIPAKLRFLSVEPLLGPIQLTKVCGLSFNRNSDHTLARQDGAGIDWVIIGGESGPKARRCDADWIRHLVHQCKSSGVPCFVKQLGSHSGQVWSVRAGIGEPLGNIHHPKGGDPAEWPEDLRVREFPSL